MFFSAIGNKFLPTFSNILWTMISAILLVFAFPDYEIWFLAYIALIPLFYAIEKEKDSSAKSFVLGWIWGICFFFGSCWWIAFPMKTYAGIPSVIAYVLALCVTIIAGIFPAIFAFILAKSLKRFGIWAVLFAPFIWVFTEFLRFWLTGDNWNAIGYSQAFAPKFIFDKEISNVVSTGGIYFVSFKLLVFNSFFSILLLIKRSSFLKNTLILSNLLAFILSWVGLILFLVNPKLQKLARKKYVWKKFRFQLCFPFLLYFVLGLIANFGNYFYPTYISDNPKLIVVAIQPNIPMNGLTFEQWKAFRKLHVELAEKSIRQIPDKYADRFRKEFNETTSLELANEITRKLPKAVIFPESPMNFEYAKDSEFREFIKNFAVKNNVSVLFNSGEPVYPQYVRREPDTLTQEQIGQMLETYNSAVLVDEKGELAAQYDKIHLLPFGEFIPLPKPLADFVPPVVGNFTFGKEFDILNFGDVKAGVMICFESHFPSLSREYANRNADVLIEMTNDGYLGNTPILRQHLANAVFRAVETNRPVLRVTNVGITAYINERGDIIEPTEGYTEDTRIWTISKSNGEKTFYVKYGDWIAWLSSFITLALLLCCFKFKKHK